MNTKENKNMTLAWLVYFLLVLTILSGCGINAIPMETAPTTTLTDTPVPTATFDWFPATLTPTLKYPTKTPGPLSDITPPSKGKILFTDTFDDGSLWELYDARAGTVAFGESNISLAVVGNKQSLVSLSEHVLPSDFYLEVMAEVTMCSDQDHYGIVLWHFSEMGTHQILYRCNGEIRLERIIYDNNTPLQDWILARRLKPDSPSKNKLGIWAQDGKLYFFVNDTYQFSAEVRSNLSGKMGFIASSSGEQAMTVVFSDLVVYEPLP